jgi:beta-phosphoglucomutase family hydrolase
MRRLALLFDMDGVVCDNMPAHEEAWRRFFRRHGIELEAEEFREKTMGMPTRDVLAYYLKRAVPPEEAATLAAVKEKIYRELYEPRRRALLGLRALLAAAHAENWGVGLGTGSKDDNVSFILDGLRLRASFDAIVDGGMVTRGKPDPETFLTLAAKLKAAPRDCIVFEDSLLGEEAARRAGMAVVGITTTHRADEFRRASLTVANFKKVSPASLVLLAASAPRKDESVRTPVRRRASSRRPSTRGS